MNFYGLFVGIDRYSSKELNELDYAERDARALYSIFTDTLGGETSLIVGERATRAEISNKFEHLTKVSEDDLVVITFSGHGIETHELATYDANPEDYHNSCISLDTLSIWLSKIPSKRLICILDCCFSGGMGAKGLSVDVHARDSNSTSQLISQLSGDGRIVLTACSGSEKAWEYVPYRHGLLSYYLLEALQGADEVRIEGKIDILSLLSYVTRKVVDYSDRRGRQQHPSILGKIDGSLNWPIFKPGILYSAAFPETASEPVTEDFQSLTTYAFPKELIQTWAGSIPSLNQIQLDAINKFNLLKGENLLVSAPTSSGKTMIGELAALKGALDHKRAFFLFPLKAIVNDKHRYFQQMYGSFGIRTIKATGETSSDDIKPLMKGQYDICLMTYEKFSALILTNPYLLDQAGTVIIDEVQMIADKARGINLEFLLTILRMRRIQEENPQIIALSAVIGNTNGLERWLGARLLLKTDRPVPLDEGVLKSDGTYRYIYAETQEERVQTSFIQPILRKGSNQDYIIPLVKKLVEEGQQVIVFRETRSIARSCALYLARSLGLQSAQETIDALPNTDISLISKRIRESLQGGVAFHISDLIPEERQVIEENFRTKNSKIRVIVATTTLAMGVNTPAETVVIAGLEHPGNQPYSIAEYKNMVGRAGRLGQANRGASFIIVGDQSKEYYYWTRYVLGNSEDLNSRFLAKDTDPRSLIIRVLVAAKKSHVQGMTAEEIVEFLEGSFGVFQQRQVSDQWCWDKDRLLQALGNLRNNNLIELINGERYHLTQIGRFAGEAGIEVESVIRIVDSLTGVSAENINDPALIALTQLSTELDKVLFPINKKSTNSEPRTWFGELQQQNVPGSILRSLARYTTEQHEAGLRAKKAVACLFWITNKSLSEIEDLLTQFWGRFDGASGAIRAVASRTCDILPTVAKIAEILNPGLDLQRRLSRLLIRLEQGVPASMIDIAGIAGNKLSRGDYQKLLLGGLNVVEELEKSTDDRILSYVVGDKNKLLLLRQIQRELAKIPEKKENPILPAYEG